jgi:hypothetical protein
LLVALLVVLVVTATPAFALVNLGKTLPGSGLITPIGLATGVTLNKSTLTLTENEMITSPTPTATLTATVTPSTADQAVTWISDTPGVATVNNGVVTAVAAGTANITVSTAGGGITSTCVVAVTAATATPTPTTTGAPSVTGISPSSGSTAGGTTVTITGSGFTGATAVNFGSAAATGATVNTDSSITATSPAGSAGAVDVTVVTPSGASTTSSNDQFTYTTTTTTTLPATGQTVLQFYIGSTNYNVNGQAQSMDTAPLISEGRTLLPIRYVATPLGATVNWDQSQQMVTVTLGSNTIQLVIGQNSASVNGVATPIDSTNPAVTPVIVAGRTMLPLRFIAESLGCQVNWNQAQQLVTVTYLQQ